MAGRLEIVRRSLEGDYRCGSRVSLYCTEYMEWMMGRNPGRSESSNLLDL